MHKGYHYPRSILTASSSTRNYDYFVNEFSDAINKNDRSYYAIAKASSKISASQFERFCAYLDMPCAKVDDEISNFFNSRLIESVFKVQETTFNCEILREILRERLVEAGVNLKLACPIFDITSL